MGDLKSFASEVNKRFPNIKMFVEGGGYSKPVTVEIPEND